MTFIYADQILLWQSCLPMVRGIESTQFCFDQEGEMGGGGYPVFEGFHGTAVLVCGFSL